MARTPTGESSIARAARIIAAFTADETSLTVTEIAKRTGLHIATTSRLIAELTAHGLLARGPGREVRVGVRLWELVARASPVSSLRDAAMPYLEDLHAVVGHHAQLGVLDGDDVLFVERLSAREAVINFSQIAGRLPAHLSSCGHVLAAHASTDTRDRMLRRPMRRYTAATITDPARLKRAWSEVRSQGYAFLPGHVHEDATGLAVPIRDPLNEVVAGLSVIVPNDERARSAVPALLAAARGVTRTLSGRR